MSVPDVPKIGNVGAFGCLITRNNLVSNRLIDEANRGPERRAAAEEERLRQLSLLAPVRLEGSGHYTSLKLTPRNKPISVVSREETESAFPLARIWIGQQDGQTLLCGGRFECTGKHDHQPQEFIAMGPCARAIKFSYLHHFHPQYEQLQPESNPWVPSDLQPSMDLFAEAVAAGTYTGMEGAAAGATGGGSETDASEGSEDYHQVQRELYGETPGGDVPRPVKRQRLRRLNGEPAQDPQHLQPPL